MARAVRFIAWRGPAVEGEFGAAVNIEAAVAAGRWYLLQSRPITTPEVSQMSVPSTAEGDDFPIVWQEPSDPELSWDRDDMHMPFALAPLAGDYIRVIGMGWGSRYQRFGLPISVGVRIWNGYAYFASRIDAPEAEHAAIEGRRLDAARAHARIARRYWDTEAMPELAALYERLTTLAAVGPPRVAAADAWEEAWRLSDRAWQIHFYAITGPYQALDDLADLYEALMEEASPGESLSLVQGSISVLHDVERGLEHLAELASNEPALAAHLALPDPATIDELSGLLGHDAFKAALEEFLAVHGHLGQSFDDLASPSWAEDPSLLLSELAVRVRRPGRTSGDRWARLVAEAAALAEAARVRLAGKPLELEQFEQQLSLAREAGPLTETHNYWIDRMAQARLRRFVVHVGDLLAGEGLIADPLDVFYLHRDEVPAVLRAPTDQRELVVRRQAEHAHWRSLKAPPSVGKVAPPSASNRFEGARFDSTEGDVLRGTGASAGVVRGPARLVLSEADFGRVQPGDIIVCPSSNPSWVPLFAIAGGLVTDTGGVLSHAAVVAREFGLPAVVGTGDATTRIADGRIIEIDGAGGLVRLL